MVIGYDFCNSKTSSVLPVLYFSYTFFLKSTDLLTLPIIFGFLTDYIYAFGFIEPNLVVTLSFAVNPSYREIYLNGETFRLLILLSVSLDSTISNFFKVGTLSYMVLSYIVLFLPLMMLYKFWGDMESSNISLRPL